MIISIFILSLVINHTQGWWSRSLDRTPVCYDHIGCFSNNARGKLPQSPDHINTQFLLNTRQNAHREQLLNPYDPTTIENSNYNGMNPTLFIVHGYQDDGKAEWVQTMTNAFLENGDANVIAVNWEGGADNLIYSQAAANTQVVGATIGELLKTLHSVANTNYAYVHLVGHSLGSHISGYAGAYLNGKIGKITGLDPAGPLFENTDSKTRLDQSDALYVEAIHTDAGSENKLGFGLEIPVGHADFYPNGGDKQLGCDLEFRTHTFNLITGKIEQFKSTTACSHMRAIDYFTESINSACYFRGKLCNSKTEFNAGHCTSCGRGCADMGYNSQQKGHGTYYFSTNAEAPFCK